MNALVVLEQAIAKLVRERANGLAIGVMAAGNALHVMATGNVLIAAVMHIARRAITAMASAQIVKGKAIFG